MDVYRKKLIKQNYILLLFIVILFLSVCTSYAAMLGFLPLRPVTGDSKWHWRWLSMLCGASTGGLVPSVMNLVSNLRALKDEAKLKKRYHQVYDERNKAIEIRALSTAMYCFLVLGMLAVIVSGYFSAIISITILACVSAAVLLFLFFTVYYRKKL